MNTESIFSKKNIQTIILIGLIVMIIGLIFSALQTPKYQASTKLLVVVNQENVDSYTASRTADYIANILGEIIYSNSFISQVYQSDFHPLDELGFDANKRAKTWEKAVKVRIKENKGVIFIDVLNKDKNEAEKTLLAINYILTTKHTTYHGLGDKVAVKVIDQVTTTNSPVQPKIIYNGLIGLLVGLIVGFTLIIIFPEQKIFKIIFPFSSPLKQDETIELNGLADLSDTDESNKQEPDQKQFYNW